MPCGKPELKFYDVKTKKSFKSSDYKIVPKKVRGKKRINNNNSKIEQEEIKDNKKDTMDKLDMD